MARSFAQQTMPISAVLGIRSLPRESRIFQSSSIAQISRILPRTIQWVFVHEIAHVWQWGHSIYPVNAAVGLFLQNVADYTKAYPYDLAPGNNLSDFNIEQQASIVADYWALLTQKLTPQDNKNPKAALGDYTVVIDQLQKSGPSIRKLDQFPL
jgi:hypothetical protein